VICMLNLVRQTLPVCNTEWQYVAECHQAKFPQQQRDETSLKLKFNKLCKTKMGTGNKPIPKAVKEALVVQRMINQKVDASTLDNESLASNNTPDADIGAAGGGGVGDSTPSARQNFGGFISSSSGGAPVVNRIRSTPRGGRVLQQNADIAATLNAMLAQQVANDLRNEQIREERERRRQDVWENMAMVVSRFVQSYATNATTKSKKKKKRKSDSSTSSSSSSSSSEDDSRTSKKNKRNKRKKRSKQAFDPYVVADDKDDKNNNNDDKHNNDDRGEGGQMIPLNQESLS
jgi:hypothetical protein